MTIYQMADSHKQTRYSWFLWNYYARRVLMYGEKENSRFIKAYESLYGFKPKNMTSKKIQSILESIAKERG